MMKEEHKQQRKATRTATRSRRKTQVCKTYTLKIDYSHCNKQQKYWLKKIFLEAKWFYNYILSHENVFDTSLRKKDKITVKVLEKTEQRSLEFLSSQMRTDLHERVCNAIKALSMLKSKHFTVGKLKFVPEINSIGLKQHNVTWKFDKNRIKIQGLKKPFKIQGIKQLPASGEYTCARVIRKPSGYYIQVTVYQDRIEKDKANRSVGVDFGIKDNIVTSDGEKFNVKIPESRRLKRNKLFFSKKTKGSKARWKQQIKIRKEYEKISNQKKDKTNKIVSYLKNNYDEIYIQDEQIANWHKGLFGRQIQMSALGAIKASLKQLESTHVIDKWQPTTKLCPSCGTLNKPTLAERIYTCSCGYSQDRDIHSAQNILLIGQKQKSSSGMERISTTSEDQTSGFSKSNLDNLSQDSLKMEAPAFRQG